MISSGRLRVYYRASVYSSMYHSSGDFLLLLPVGICTQPLIPNRVGITAEMKALLILFV